MKVQTTVKAGAFRGHYHNEQVAGVAPKAPAKSLRVKTSVKAGAIVWNHNETCAKALTVKTGVKAGGRGGNHNQVILRAGRKA